MRLTYEQLSLKAHLEEKAFRKLIEDIPYERKGILYSEMFFMYLCLKDSAPQTILESGRARGQSTLILSKIFPDSEIISIEHDETSVDVQVAYERLKNCKNVKLMFGDATTLLPNLANKYPNSIVLIDGPKGFRAVRLALKLLKIKNVLKIFVHDTSYDTQERKFLKKHFPDLIYSDMPEISEVTRMVDDVEDLDIPESYRYRYGHPYGYCLACFETYSSSYIRGLVLRSRVAQFINRILRKK